MINRYTLFFVTFISGCSTHSPQSQNEEFIIPEGDRTWLAGDHHIHGKYSAKWNLETSPPTPILFGDAHYFTALNATMAKMHGLDWMVTTDHGGPGHSKLNLDQAYPELLDSRKAVPQVLQFYGMEFDMPSARHGSLIIPKSEKEAEQLFEIESKFNRREVSPHEYLRGTQAFMLKALEYMQTMSPKPILAVNHPSRQAPKLNVFTKVTPEKMRQWQDAAPDVITGMTAIPGHQAASINPDGSNDPTAERAEYYGYPTHGGTDQMSAIVGGVWDSLLGEGRKWSVTAVSDSHAHYTEGRTDFWPGEYAKTYVYAKKDYASVLEAFRAGNVFITTGDLIDSLFVSVSQGEQKAQIGESLTNNNSAPLVVNIAFKTPKQKNFNGDSPSVARVDLIYGEVLKDKKFIKQNINPTTKVVKRFYPKDWKEQGDYQVMSFTLPMGTKKGYIRVRGTNLLNELEPEVDLKGENPWDDLWFYSNPVYIK
ncbi:phosphoesterase [Pseudoalteromonas lipolytica]|uniref:phosphoesterase n=1 Tax=Pseudoalteromonas lipolytica TaxID=570156 RepID=UPI00241CD62F|nr:phosphoesterase [Pseudoalteromonas lipolytica]|tara:strand:- start:2253 stop:3695 length:1443 start_codon:yes stop_codon:yes gene_type:complete